MEHLKYSLPNGLEVILRRDARLPVVAVNIWYHVGPANETKGRTGFAHLFEHMMFQGSGHTGEDAHFRLLEGAGASLVNGTTDFDRTNYLEDLPSNQLELALWLESDRMGFLLDRLGQSMLTNQQDVVRNERRQSVENAPYGLVDEEVWHQLFPEGHPYYASVIGSHEDIQAARLEDVRDFFKRFYAPNNASLAIVGDIDVDRTKALVEKYFSSIPRGPEVPRIDVVTPPIQSERRSVVTDRVELPRIYLAWLSPTIFQPGDAEAELASRILGGGKASRLYERLVYRERIAQGVRAWQQSLQLASVFQIMATAKPGHTADELEAAIDEEIARFAAEGPTEEEIRGAKNSIRADIWMSLENLGNFAGVADRLNRYNHYLGDPGYLEKDLARYEAVTGDGVRRIVAEILRRDRRVVVHGIPGEKNLPPDPAVEESTEAVDSAIESGEPWRNEVPRPAVAVRPKLPAPLRSRLANGLEVYVVESRALPIVSANLVLRSGSAADPESLHGLAGFTASMLDEGTEHQDPLQLARRLEMLGAFLSASSDHDGSFVWIRSLRAQAESALGLWAEVALSPAFAEKEIERIRDERITALLQRRDSATRTASRVLYPCLYGPRHPYGHITLGDEDALRRISRADLLDFYRSRYSPTDSAIVFAGDVSHEEALALAQRWFGSWRGGAVSPSEPPLPMSTEERVVIVDRPESPQTALLVAQTAVPRSHPDFEALHLMNQVLGGLFSSRINLNLRERHGYTYGAYSGVSESRGLGMLYVGASVRSDATGASVREIFREVRGMLESEVSEEELRLAKDSMIRSLPALFETTETIVASVSSLFLHELPIDYYETLPARIESLSARDVLEATRRHLTPERMIVIAVGEGSVVAPQIAELELGPMRFRDAEGRLAIED